MHLCKFCMCKFALCIYCTGTQIVLLTKYEWGKTEYFS